MYRLTNFIAPWIIVLLLFLADCGMPPGVPPGGFTPPGPLLPLGHIIGFIDASLLNDNVMITTTSDGLILYSSMATDGPGQPVQFITTLPTGTYDLTIKADGHATAVITGIPVSGATTSYMVTMVSTSATPITLPTSTMRNISGMVLLNPPSASTDVYLFSNQTFSGGPTVTVNIRRADQSTGEYTMSLPVAAPLLGQYGTGTLPIMFTSQSAIAGKYTVVATYSVYMPQSVSTDISITDVIQNFTLTPY